jgi:hypothetical protein
MNEAQLSTLAAEITNDPLSRGYSGMTDAAAADSINTSNRPTYKAVYTADIRRYVLINLIMPALKDARTTGSTAEIKNVADTAYEMLFPGAFVTIELQDPSTYSTMSAMMDILVSASVITTDQKAAILALRNTTRTRAAELDIPAPTHLDVAYSRGVR